MAIGPRSYKQSEVKKLYALSGNSCYNPECTHELVFPTEKSGSFAHVSDIAHIRGAQEHSARYDESMTDDERRSYKNLIVLCPTCHGKVDNLELVTEYTCERLEKWKRAVEQSAGRSKSKTDSPTINVSNSPGSIATVNQIGDNIIGMPAPTMSILRREVTRNDDGLFKLEILVGSIEGVALMNASFEVLFQEPFDKVESFVQPIDPVAVSMVATSMHEEIGEERRFYRVTPGLVGPGHGLALRFIFPTEPTILESKGTVSG